MEKIARKVKWEIRENGCQKLRVLQLWHSKQVGSKILIGIDLNTNRLIELKGDKFVFRCQLKVAGGGKETKMSQITLIHGP